MKFVADENLGFQIPVFLRYLGFDIISIAEVAPGIIDLEVLRLSNRENRILITLDKDFGELVFKHKLLHSGIILLRLKDESVDNKKKVLLKALKSKRNFSDRFTIIKD